ncbi:2OG-Fe(II) oxygenase [Permianibacter sp. IMCC34836]|uniref:2OG-Fe(II) oxygenase n=1 Tax=Permianibacter fluminis TaxID=2738515 RepID=UPI001555403B|nr:2OG-Fe(II) oxygenase [Permianibacter fluminis]NQD38388.1 2OG-Fe(II) oxygenase [Permianibacter fluminis]
MLRQPDLPALIAEQLAVDDFLVIPEAIDSAAVTALRTELLAWREHGRLQPAAVGRGTARQLSSALRTDLTAWLTGETAIQQQWLAVMAALQQALNRRLLLGLSEYEAHYACYPPGSFYKRHLDSFRGSNSRRVSTVLYLNEAWQADDGGLLQLYNCEHCIRRVVPEPGTLVIFLSDAVPHEVTDAKRERYSIAGWLRQREST